MRRRQTRPVLRSSDHEFCQPTFTVVPEMSSGSQISGSVPRSEVVQRSPA